MNVQYKTYASDSGFEKIQTDIYNQAVKRYNGTNVTVEHIKNRIKSGKPPQDTEGIRFAVSDKGEGLAYIQYRLYDQGKQLYIGYPWAVDGCPSEVQEKLYSDLETYLKNKFSDHSDLYLGYISNDYKEVTDWIKGKNFDFYGSYTEYELELEKLGKLDVRSDVTVKEATSDDLKTLIDLGLSSNLQSMGEKGLSSYFKDKVIPDGNCLILFKDNVAVASTAILQGYYDGKASLFRFMAIKEGYDEYQKPLLKHVSSMALKNGLKLPVRASIGYKQREERKYIIDIGKEMSTATAYKKALH